MGQDGGSAAFGTATDHSVEAWVSDLQVAYTSPWGLSVKPSEPSVTPKGVVIHPTQNLYLKANCKTRGPFN